MKRVSPAPIDRGFLLFFLAIWGGSFVFGAGLSLVHDVLVRINSHQTTGTFVGYSGRNGIVEYTVDGQTYRTVSQRSGDLAAKGTTETVVYSAINPAIAVDGSAIWMELFALALGIGALRWRSKLKAKHRR